MSGLDASAVANLLVEIGQRLALAGENPYKAPSYTRAAQALSTLIVPLDEVIAQGRLQELPGVGAALAETILKLHRDGTTPKLQAMRAEVPASALAMLGIPGLRGPKVLDIIRKLGVTSIEGLEQACREGRLQSVKGLGPSLQAKVLTGIELMRSSQGQRLIHHAGELLKSIEAELKRSRPELSHIVLAGQYRRGCELVSDLALVAQSADGSGVRVHPIAEDVKLWIADRRSYGAALVLATGSAGHLAQLERRANSMGLELDEKGLFRGKRVVPCTDEETLYSALDLPLIAPELREGSDEVELAAAGRLPQLVAHMDIRGLLHCHTDFSDGGNTLREMAEATRRRAYTYFGVADHSRSAAYAGGLSTEEIEEQHRLAEALNARYRGKFRILKGIESDILEDGSLDYPDEVLARFDYVVASVHSRFKLDLRAQTARIVRAVSNPFTTILGHMTGRLLRRREGYELDIEKVLKACAKHDVAVEINANPHRLDLDWRWHRRAMAFGCMFSINPDAHSTEELDLTRWGVLMARKGSVPRERVLNCLGSEELTAFLDSRRKTRRSPRVSHQSRARRRTSSV